MEDKKKYAYNYLLNKGLTNIQAAAIVGNLQVESGFNTSAEGDKGYSGGSSRGIAQWREGRLSNLKNFAGSQWTSLDKQLDFVLHELNTSEKGAFDKLKEAKTVEQATEAFTRGYERPNMSQAHLGKRISHALSLAGVAPDANFKPQGGEMRYDPSTGEEMEPYKFKELYGDDFYAPKDSQNVSSLDDSQESSNLAEQEKINKSEEIKARLEQKKSERDFMVGLIKNTQVAYVDPTQYQGDTGYAPPQQFQKGGSFKSNEQAFLNEYLRTGGKVIKGDRGQWDNPGEITQINSSNITMKPDPITGKPLTQNVLGIDNLGNRQMMTPGNDYTFPGNVVTEYPQTYQNGGSKLPWYQDAGVFKKNWGQAQESVYDSLTKEATSLNDDAAAAGVPQGQGVYVGDASDPTYISPDNRLEEVVITSPKRQVDPRFKNIQPKDERLDSAQTKDNTEVDRFNIEQDKNLNNPEALKKQLEVSDANKAKIAAKELKKLESDRSKMLLDMKGRRNDLDIFPKEFEEIEKTDLLSEYSVMDAQKKLKDLGYNLNPNGNFKNEGIDGKLGLVTNAAIAEYNNKGGAKKSQYSSYKSQEGFLGKCQEGQCSEYVQNEIFRNYGPNVNREEWTSQTGLFGDAWTIGKNIIKAGGSEVKSSDLKAGDVVTMFTGGRSSYMGQAKAAGTDATHVGVIDKINPDGSYYILHNVHKTSPLSYALQAIDPKHKPDYEGQEYRELVKDGKIVSGQNNSGFSIRKSYRPEYSSVKPNPNTATIRKDTLIVPSNNLDPEMAKASKVFVSTLNNQKNKGVIAKKYGISENDYQSLAQVTLGIIQQETKYSTSARQGPKQVAATLAKIVGLKDDEVSKGAGQVKFTTNFGKADITEFGITEDNFTKDENTALVIMSIITPYYTRLIKNGESKENALYKAVEKYNRGSNTDYSDNLDVDYVNKVIGYGQNFDVKGGNKETYNTLVSSLNSDKRTIANNADRKKREKINEKKNEINFF